MNKIEAVIFDWGGVLADDPRPGLMQYCAKTLDVSQQEYIKAHSKFAEQFQKGIISEQTFWIKVCGQLNRPVPTHPSLWGQAFQVVYRPRDKVFALAAELQKNGIKTALLSNTEVPAMEFFYGHGYDMFGVLVFSCTEGAIKPERKIYRITLKKLRSEPGQTVFIDDKPEFIEGAKQVGINTVLFSNIEQIRKGLSNLGVEII
jgi:putative hydrolase of the HAD superfamily